MRSRLGVSVLSDFKAPFSSMESWAYDKFIAPAVVGFAEAVADDLIDGHMGGEPRLLDVGCGGGQVVQELATRYPGARVTGLDLSPEQVERAQRRTAGFGARVEIMQGSALDLPFPDETFEFVLSVASLKHWPDAGRGLAECARVLKPGGAACIIEADRGCRLEDAQAFVARWRVPGAANPLLLTLFRTFVAGRSYDLDEARALVEGHDGPAVGAVRRLPGTPAFAIELRRPRT